MAPRTLRPLLFAALLLAGCGGTDRPTETPGANDSTTAPAAAAQDGPQVIHMDDGGRMEGDLKAGQRTGPWTSYFPNGTVRSRSTYVEGVEEGATEVYHPNGKPYYTGAYRHGQPTGQWVFYDLAGSELNRVVYDSLGVVRQP